MSNVVHSSDNSSTTETELRCNGRLSRCVAADRGERCLTGNNVCQLNDIPLTVRQHRQEESVSALLSETLSLSLSFSLCVSPDIKSAELLYRRIG